MATLNDLLDYIFEGKKSSFYTQFETWTKDSRRFKDFAIDYRSKIRTKLKNANGTEGAKDVHAELKTAFLLLQEKRFSLEYEKNAASKQRNPDFTVTFKTHTPFNLEVRRIRSIESNQEDNEATLFKLIAILCEKLKQMPPSMMNLLWLVDERGISLEDISQAMLKLLQMAQSKEEDFFMKRGFTNASNFLKQHRQLSAIVLVQEEKLSIWQNSLARHKASAEIINSLQRLKAL